MSKWKDRLKKPREKMHNHPAWQKDLMLLLKCPVCKEILISEEKK